MTIFAWRPPTLRNPLKIRVPARDDRYRNGMTHLSLSTLKDYIIDLPPERKIGGLSLYGGRNVHIIGGYISPNPDHDTYNGNWRNAAVRIHGNKGTVHIEGLLIDSSVGGQGDGIHITGNPQGIVQIVNNRIWNILAGPGAVSHIGVHGDVIQLYSPNKEQHAAVRELRIDKLTASSSASCFQIQGWGPSKIRRVNLSFWEGEGIRYHAKLLRMTEPGTCRCAPHKLTEVYADASLYPDIHERIAPEGHLGKWCEAVEREDGTWHWPQLPIAGFVTPGVPPGGDFVPAGSVGAQYVNPDY